MRILCILACIVSLSVVTAQESDLKRKRWGVELEMNEWLPDAEDDRNIWLFYVCASREYQLTGKFYGGFKTGFGVSNANAKYISVPILLTFKYEFTSGRRFTPYACLDFGVDIITDMEGRHVVSCMPDTYPIWRVHPMLGVNYMLSNKHKIYFSSGCSFVIWPEVLLVASLGYQF